MERLGRGVGLAGLGLAVADLAALHVLPTLHLHARTGTSVPYRPWNFLSELVRTEAGPWMTLCFVLLAVGALGAAGALRRLRPEALLLAVAGVSLALLAFFPTDLADLSTDALTCGRPTRIEPCTWVGRIHNPLSTAVFVPIAAVMASLGLRGRRDPRWRFAARWGVVCGALALAGVVGATLYLQSIGWQGRWWTGLMQRSLVAPSLLWLAGVLAALRPPSPQP